MRKKKDEITINRDEAQLAKRALQAVLDDLEELKRHASTGSVLARLNDLQGKTRVGIIALRDADRHRNADGTKRDFE